MPASTCRSALTLLLCACSALLTGCGAHFYHAGRDTTAQAAKKSYEEAKVLDIIVAERTNLGNLLDRELGVANRHLDTVLRAEWFRLIDSSEPLSKSLVERGIERRLEQLGFVRNNEGALDDDTLARAATMTVGQGQRVNAKVVEAADIIRLRFKVDPPPCDAAVRSADIPEPLANVAKDNPALKELWNEYHEACIEASTGPIPEGPLKQALGAIQEARNQLEGERKRQRQALEAYQKALKEYEAAATPLPTDAKEFEGKVQALRELLDGGVKAAGALGQGASAAERLKHLDVLLRATAGEMVDAATIADPEVKKAVMVVATSRALTDEARAIAADRRAPPVAGLLIEKQRQEALRNAAARRVERAQRRIELHEAQFAALVHEVYLLQRARVAVAAAQKAAGDTGDPFASPLGSGISASNLVARRLVYQTLFHYLDSIVTARRRQEEVDYRLIALDHEEAVDASETAIALWNGLIATPVNQLAAYHSSGLKAEQIAALLVQFVTLGSIGVGVNR